MSTTQTPVGFNLEAFLTRVVPGLVFISPILLDAWIDSPIDINNSSISLLIIALVAMVFGELIEQMRAGLFRVPIPFSYHIYNHTEDDSHLPIRHEYLIKINKRLPDRFKIGDFPDKEYRLENRLQFNFQEEIEEELDLDPNSALPRDFYDGLLLYIGDEFSTQTKKHQQTYIFGQNLKLATAFSLIFYFWLILLKLPNPIVVLYIAAVVVLLTFVFLVTRFMMRSPNLYVEMLFKEFYMMNRDN